MVNQAKTLARLHKERNYEEKLVDNLGTYFLSCLDSIPDLKQKEKEIIHKNLNIIMKESMKHNYQFTELIEMVLKNEEDNY